MLNTQQLDAMSNISLSEADKTKLVDIASVHIDTSLPAAERMKNYLQQIKNPYLFRSGKIAVRVRFEPNGAELGDLLKRHFILLKRG
jgi:hypothetical protein